MVTLLSSSSSSLQTTVKGEGALLGASPPHVSHETGHCDMIFGSEQCPFFLWTAQDLFHFLFPMVTRTLPSASAQGCGPGGGEGAIDGFSLGWHVLHETGHSNLIFVSEQCPFFLWAAQGLFQFLSPMVTRTLPSASAHGFGDGIDEGFSEGLKDGFDEGENEGFDEGLKEGPDEGNPVGSSST